MPRVAALPVSLPQERPRGCRRYRLEEISPWPRTPANGVALHGFRPTLRGWEVGVVTPRHIRLTRRAWHAAPALWNAGCGVASQCHATSDPAPTPPIAPIHPPQWRTSRPSVDHCSPDTVELRCSRTRVQSFCVRQGQASRDTFGCCLIHRERSWEQLAASKGALFASLVLGASRSLQSHTNRIRLLLLLLSLIANTQPLHPSSAVTSQSSYPIWAIAVHVRRRLRTFFRAYSCSLLGTKTRRAARCAPQPLYLHARGHSPFGTQYSSGSQGVH